MSSSDNIAPIQDTSLTHKTTESLADNVIKDKLIDANVTININNDHQEINLVSATLLTDVSQSNQTSNSEIPLTTTTTTLPQIPNNEINTSNALNENIPVRSNSTSTNSTRHSKVRGFRGKRRIRETRRPTGIVGNNLDYQKIIDTETKTNTIANEEVNEKKT
ncbi:hypothetical protein SNEBB_000254 [Seison nebaliae]|nr:hypothetical protein SNEBB_000254 [Seison nebaliae]